MKFTIFFFIAVFCGIYEVGAATGCNINGNGGYVYTTLNNPAINPATGNPLYSASDKFTSRTFGADKNCGILATNMSAVSPLIACDVVGVATYGITLTYNPSMNTCPIDDFIPFLTLAVLGFGFYNIKSKLL